MVFQKGRPRPPLRVKTCIICRKSYQPMSGAQKTCGEPDCKAQAKALNLANRKARIESGVNLKEEVARALEKPLLTEERGYFLQGEADQQTPSLTPHGNGRGSHRSSGEPTLELDLAPLETYVKQIVAQAQGGGVASEIPDNQELRELIREIVREEIAAMLKPLVGS